jgi:hypothetical protein
MEILEFWIEGGRIVPCPIDEVGKRVPDKVLLHRRDLVKIESSGQGTTIKWACFSANWASLLFAKEWVQAFNGPYRLHFFNTGWFIEQLDTAEEARARIDRFVAVGDVKLSSKVYTQTFDPLSQKLPQSLRKSWESGLPPESETVLSSLNLSNGQSQVEHVGPKSALASVWGISSATYPCLSGHSYDRAVSKSYFEVARSGRPHYDHVLAAMTQPDGEVQWFSYQRLVFSGKKSGANFHTVNVISEGSPVDIAVM